MPGSDVVLSVIGLSTHFGTRRGVVVAVDDVSLELRRGETVAIVGESGSGKSITCFSCMRLVEAPGRIVAGSILLRRRDGTLVDLVEADEAVLRAIRGNEIAMVFQEPMTSLNPVFTVGDQIAEAIRFHQKRSRRDAWLLAGDMLSRVGIADPPRRLRQFPHELSGGMRQRVMIAIALSCNPSVLIADEATTALDVTIQAQILDLLRGLQAGQGGLAILFVTHNMGVVAELADRVVVMYGARVVEEGPVREVFGQPRHPYTRALLQSVPKVDLAERAAGIRRRLAAIPGHIPAPHDRPEGCGFAPRCAFAVRECHATRPPLEMVSERHATRCLRWRELAPDLERREPAFR